jgi:hypothetical protein
MHRRFTPSLTPLEPRVVLSDVPYPMGGALPLPSANPAWFFLHPRPADEMVSPPTDTGPASRPHSPYPPGWTPADVATTEAVDAYLKGPQANSDNPPAPPIGWPCTSAEPFGVNYPMAPATGHPTPCAVLPLPVEAR